MALGSDQGINFVSYQSWQFVIFYLSQKRVVVVHVYKFILQVYVCFDAR